jgi:hypothetical protein
MHSGKAFLKPATRLQGMRSQLRRNEAAKALNPQPLPPGPGGHDAGRRDAKGA